MINFAPGVYITRYLTAVGKLDEKTEKKALNIMMKGDTNLDCTEMVSSV